MRKNSRFRLSYHQKWQKVPIHPFCPSEMRKNWRFVISARKKWRKGVDSYFLTVRNGKNLFFVLSYHQKWRKGVDPFYLTILNGKIFYFLLSDHFKRRNFIFCTLWALESLFFLFFWPIASQYGPIVYYLRCVIILKYLKYFVGGAIRWKGFI